MRERYWNTVFSIRTRKQRVIDWIGMELVRDFIVSFGLKSLMAIMILEMNLTVSLQNSIVDSRTVFNLG